MRTGRGPSRREPPRGVGLTRGEAHSRRPHGLAPHAPPPPGRSRQRKRRATRRSSAGPCTSPPASVRSPAGTHPRCTATRPEGSAPPKPTTWSPRPSTSPSASGTATTRPTPTRARGCGGSPPTSSAGTTAMRPATPAPWLGPVSPRSWRGTPTGSASGWTPSRCRPPWSAPWRGCPESGPSNRWGRVRPAAGVAHTLDPTDIGTVEHRVLFGPGTGRLLSQEQAVVEPSASVADWCDPEGVVKYTLYEFSVWIDGPPLEAPWRAAGVSPSLWARNPRAPCPPRVPAVFSVSDDGRERARPRLRVMPACFTPLCSAPIGTPLLGSPAMAAAPGSPPWTTWRRLSLVRWSHRPPAPTGSMASRTSGAR